MIRAAGIALLAALTVVAIGGVAYVMTVADPVPVVVTSPAGPDIPLHP
jgi:hypothetical protein